MYVAQFSWLMTSVLGSFLKISNCGFPLYFSAPFHRVYYSPTGFSELFFHLSLEGLFLDHVFFANLFIEFLIPIKLQNLGRKLRVLLQTLTSLVFS